LGLTHLLIVDDKGYSYLSIVGPLQAFKAFLAITFEVARERIVRVCGVDLRHGTGDCDVAEQIVFVLTGRSSDRSFLAVCLG
jgi:hypothetical protein